MQICHRWTSMYLIEHHMCHMCNSYISLCFSLNLFLSAFVHSLRVTVTAMLAYCHTICEIIQMRTPCFLCLLPWMATRKQAWSIHERHFSLSVPHYNSHPLLSLSLSVCESCRSIGGTSWALWEAINECVAWRVVMRGILQPFIRAGRHLTGGQPTGCVII